MAKNQEAAPAASVFDPDTFMHSEVETAMESTFTPVDEGEYNAYIDDVAAEAVNTNDGPKPVLNITYALTDDAVKEALDMEKPTVRQTCWLDFDEQTGGLSFGPNKNVRLGRVREAVDQNVDGQPWSPSQLIGAGPVVLKVGHRFNKETGEGPYADVQRVSAAG